MGKRDLYGAIAATGKALAHGARLEVLELLAQRDRSVQELADAVGLKLTTASAHLQVLRRSGLVSARGEGTKVIYSLAGEDVAVLVESLCRVAARQAEVERAARDYLDGGSLRVVGRERLLEDVEAGRVMVLDVRPGAEYAAGHIPGALSIPLEQLEERLGEIPDGVEVVAYCRGRYCVLSHDAARLLNARGRAAAVLSEGMLEWRAEGLPVAA